MISSEVAVSVRGLGKAYTIAHNAAKHTTAGEALMHRLKHPFQKVEKETFWALKDVSFEIQKGDVVGIIGRNGAGKSTLLKILSRITEPTAGEIDLFGRVGSLLEVGTGFHPELTGRENIYLNGAILGMRRGEIARQFDAIVEFSGTEKFLDTPVKRYSSGMYVRLACAVAAHLNPEILVVDEVLAVGDAEFQKKCLGKMQDISEQEGRTVLFVSHNMAAIENLCKTVILFERGRIDCVGRPKEVTQRFLEEVLPTALDDTPLAERKDRTGSGILRLTDFHIEDANGKRLLAAASGMDVVFVLGYECCGAESLDKVDIGFSLALGSHQLLTVLYSSYTGTVFDGVPSRGEFRCLVSNLPVGLGRYYVGARVFVAGVEADWPKDAIGYLDVESGDFFGTGVQGHGAGAPLMMTGQWMVRGS